MGLAGSRSFSAVKMLSFADIAAGHAGRLD